MNIKGDGYMYKCPFVSDSVVVASHALAPLRLMQNEWEGILRLNEYH